MDKRARELEVPTPQLPGSCRISVGVSCRTALLLHTGGRRRRPPPLPRLLSPAEVAAPHVVQQVRRRQQAAHHQGFARCQLVPEAQQLQLHDRRSGTPQPQVQQEVAAPGGEFPCRPSASAAHTLASLHRCVRRERMNWGHSGTGKQPAWPQARRAFWWDRSCLQPCSAASQHGAAAPGTPPAAPPPRAAHPSTARLRVGEAAAAASSCRCAARSSVPSSRCCRSSRWAMRANPAAHVGQPVHVMFACSSVMKQAAGGGTQEACG